MVMHLREVVYSYSHFSQTLPMAENRKNIKVKKKYNIIVKTYSGHIEKHLFRAQWNCISIIIGSNRVLRLSRYKPNEDEDFPVVTLSYYYTCIYWGHEFKPLNYWDFLFLLNPATSTPAQRVWEGEVSWAKNHLFVHKVYHRSWTPRVSSASDSLICCLNQIDSSVFLDNPNGFLTGHVFGHVVCWPNLHGVSWVGDRLSMG